MIGATVRNQTPQPRAQAKRTRYAVGLDLGKQSDPSALALLRWQWPPAVNEQTHQLVPVTYDVPTLQRWALGTPYLTIVDDLIRFCRMPPLVTATPLIVLDATGVGEAIAEMVAQRLVTAKIPGGFVGVTITAGAAVTHVGGGRWHVAKRHLVSVLQRLLGERRLHVAEQLAEARELVYELGTFSAKITLAGNETFEAWRDRDHDDMVLAVALAAWAAEYLDPSSIEA